MTLVGVRGTGWRAATIRITDFRIRDPQQNAAAGQPAELHPLAP